MSWCHFVPQCPGQCNVPGGGAGQELCPWDASLSTLHPQGTAPSRATAPSHWDVCDLLALISAGQLSREK